MPSVVIPAHNEVALIGRCVSAILADGVEDLELVVAANGCSDETVEIAQSFGPRVRVLDIEAPGKTNALNMAERAVRSFPRLFIDGDIVVQPGAIAAVLRELERPGIEIASPPPIFQTEHASWPVRQFYRALGANPYFGRGSPNGSGVFGVTENGRSRWKEFPDVISDDGFVQFHFAESERATTSGPGAFVIVPADWSSLLNIQARSRIGTMQLKLLESSFSREHTGHGKRTAINLLSSPRTWTSAAVYAVMRLQERSRARAIQSSGQPQGWLRDESSRRYAECTERVGR